MTELNAKLAKAPIVEAVLDIDCDMPTQFQLEAVEAGAKGKFLVRYPKFRQRFLEEHKVESKPDEPPKISRNRAVYALQFLQDDERQLIQVRANGYSFNRLAPYGSFDDYLPEIERTWKIFLELTQAVQIRAVRLRYINRIPLPLQNGRIDLDKYLKVSPKLPEGSGLTFAGFFNQHTAIEPETGRQANLVLASQPPEKNTLPIIFDITVVDSQGTSLPENWSELSAMIAALRLLKNRIFRYTLTDTCWNQFQ